jgi:hypothetical protein
VACVSSLQSYSCEKEKKEVNNMNPFEKIFLLISLIQNTKKLWEIYKTEEIRVYLEYLKDLYERELGRSYDDRDESNLLSPDDKIIF